MDVDKQHYYIEPEVFKKHLKQYYESDIMTDELADNVKPAGKLAPSP
jgi:hypothetical protein